MLRLVPTVVTVNGITEDAVKCVLVGSDGIDTCTVAFIPKAYIKSKKVKKQLNKFVVVQKLFKDSANIFEREKDYKSLGMAYCYFLNEDEGRNE